MTSLAWSTSPFDAPMLAVGGVGVGSGEGPTAQVFGYNLALRRWLPMAQLLGHTGRVTDVAWAPNIGRSYHLIATASCDKSVGLWRLLPESATDAAGSGIGSAVLTSGKLPAPAGFSSRRLPGATCDVECVAVFMDDQQPVWR